MTTALTRLGLGNFSNVAPVGEGVSECKVDFGPGYRIYFGQDGKNLVILLAGGTKKRQANDIARAKELWRAYRKRKDLGASMALTREFKETVRARVDRDPKFRAALLKEAVDALLAGDVETGKSILRDYINATVGFEKLGHALGASPKSLMRMFGREGNPQARNLFAVLQHLQAETGVRLYVATLR